MTWQKIETAPRDGSQFLAALSNGWVVIMSEIPGGQNYCWYRNSANLGIPVVRTHREGSLTESILATHWMPLPEAPK